jgi:hypothetical protein
MGGWQFASLQRGGNLAPHVLGFWFAAQLHLHVMGMAEKCDIFSRIVSRVAVDVMAFSDTRAIRPTARSRIGKPSSCAIASNFVRGVIAQPSLIAFSLSKSCLTTHASARPRVAVTE